MSLVEERSWKKRVKHMSFAVSPLRFSFRPFPKKRPILKLPDYDCSTRISQVSHFQMLFSC